MLRPPPRHAGWGPEALRRVRPRAGSRVGPDLGAAAQELAPKVTVELLRACVEDVPEVWLADEPGFASVDGFRAAHVRTLRERVEGLAERITSGPPTVDGPSRAPGWLTDPPPGRGGGGAATRGGEGRA